MKLIDCLLEPKKIKSKEDAIAVQTSSSENGNYNKVTKYPLITSRKDDAPNFSMRLFEIGPNGFTGMHKHSYEHEVYILSGEGFVFIDNEKLSIKKDDYFIIRPYETHKLLADNNGLSFLCIVPNKYKNQPD